MSKPYVCTACRARLCIRTRSYAYRQRQWLSQAPITRQQTQQRRSVEDFPPKPLRPDQYEQVRRRGNPRPAARIPPEPQYARGRYSGKALRPEQLLDQLDQPASYSIAQNPNVRTTVSSAWTPQELRDKRQRFVDAGREGAGEEEMWSMLKELVIDYHALGRGINHLGRDMKISNKIYFLVMRVCKRWIQMLKNSTTKSPSEAASDAEQLPSPSEIMNACNIMGLIDPSAWAQVLWLIATSTAEFDATAMEASTVSKQMRTQGAHELVKVWNVCMASKLERAHSISPPPDSLSELLSPPTINWSFLPDSAAFTLSLRQKDMPWRSLGDILNLFVPCRDLNASAANSRFNPKEISYNYGSAALVTLDILQRAKAVGAEDFELREYQPLLKLLETMLKSINVRTIPRVLEHQIKFAEDERVRDYYKALVDRLNFRSLPFPGDQPPKDAQKRNITDTSLANREAKHDEDAEGVFEAEEGIPSLSQRLEDPDPFTERNNSTDRFAALCIRRLGKAVEGQNLRAAEMILSEVRRVSSQESASKLPLNLYENLILTFLSLRSSQTAGEVWNEMIGSGYQPTSKTFTVMMRGSAYVRDWATMESFWGKMRLAGIQPDAHAWSVLIFALLRRGNLNAGMKALHDMGEEWMAAAGAAHNARMGSQRKKTNVPPAQRSDLLAMFEENIGEVPRPNLVIMNSAISASAASVDKVIPKVLSWGRSFGIEPDITTYNVLLNVALRHNMPDEALNILKRMSEREVEPNSTTWTVLLTSVFQGGFMENLEPAEQETKLMNFITSLESASSAKIDGKGYALIVDRLLKVYNNTSAAQAVLTRMAESGEEPSQYIYTILMHSYFNQVPPNFAAAESLWMQIQSSSSGYGAALDSTFYDRMLEGYATHYQAVGTAPMLHFLSRMESEGKKASWRALQMVARALADAREWGRLGDLVDRQRKSLRENALTENQRYGEKDFWQFVISTGVLRDEGITTPEQVRQSGR